MIKNKNCSSRWEKLLDLPVWRLKQSGRWLTKMLSAAIKHLPDKEDVIFKAFKSSALLLMLVKKSNLFKKKILYMLESRPKNKWTTFLDKLNTSVDQNTLAIELLLMLLQELISKEKVFQPFWTPACKRISERLSLPIGTDFAGLDTNSSSNWSIEPEEKSPFLTIRSIKLQNKSLPKTSYPSSTSSLVDKWEKESMPIVKFKTLKMKIYPTMEQKLLLDEFINTSRFVFNKTLEEINNGAQINFQNLRDKLVTENTKKVLDKYKEYDQPINELREMKKRVKEEIKDKDRAKEAIVEIDIQIKTVNASRRMAMKELSSVKNSCVSAFELRTPKDIRACAVKQCCDAFKTGFSNLEKGHIKHFKMKFKKKTESTQTIELTKQIISIKNGQLRICPEYFADPILKVSKHNQKKLKDLTISHNLDIQRCKNTSSPGYYIYLTIPVCSESRAPSLDRVAGVDPGIRTFATVHTNNISTNETLITEYKHRCDLLRKYNKKIALLKSFKRTRKKHLNKLDKKKIDLTDRLHWTFINHLLRENDVVYFGDIKSHDIVKEGKNKTLNQDFNDLKFYQLKLRLVYKASCQGKKVIMVPEHYTTKTCSCCGRINDAVGSKEIFTCYNCDMVTGRDFNASKNIKMKGLQI